MNAVTITGLLVVVPLSLWVANKLRRWTEKRTTDFLDRWWPT